MLKRSLTLPKPGTDSFFLWGPRQTGKTTLLRAIYPHSRWVDLLKAEEYRRYLERPETLREELAAYADVNHVVIDEIQKVPTLLDEVHWLHENRGIRFALCGSSARKVRRGAANLLGGRAVTYELHGLTANELGNEFELDRILNDGYLPPIYGSAKPFRLLKAYAATYLKEEIAAEGLVRNLPVFSEFLNIAALSDAEIVNFSTIGRECGISSHTIKNYFSILEDTLIARWVPAYRKRPKRRVIGAPKLYFADVGIVNCLSRRGRVEARSPLYGKAFENWVFHELSAHNTYTETHTDIAHWRLASGIEVDFIVGDMKIAIEAKASAKITSDHLKGLRHLITDHPNVEKRIVACLEPRARTTTDGIQILPAGEFVRRLGDGDLF
jgi:predicted AAA+ superfamily ATPase